MSLEPLVQSRSLLPSGQHHTAPIVNGSNKRNGFQWSTSARLGGFTRHSTKTGLTGLVEHSSVKHRSIYESMWILYSLAHALGKLCPNG